MRSGSSLAKRLGVLAYGVVSYAVGVTALVAWILAMLGVVSFTGGPVGELAMGPALALDLAFLVAFGVQHSVMARPTWKARWLRVVGPTLERPTYSPQLGLAARSIALLAWSYLFVASFAIDHFELFGLRQVWSFFLGRPMVPVAFRERWMYRFDRHPIMTGALLGMWREGGPKALGASRPAPSAVHVSCEVQIAVRAERRPVGWIAGAVQLGAGRSSMDGRGAAWRPRFRRQPRSLTIVGLAGARHGLHVRDDFFAEKHVEAVGVDHDHDAQPETREHPWIEAFEVSFHGWPRQRLDLGSEDVVVNGEAVRDPSVGPTLPLGHGVAIEPLRELVLCRQSPDATGPRGGR